MTTNDKLGQSIDAKRQLRGKHVFLANKRKDLPPRISPETLFPRWHRKPARLRWRHFRWGGRDGYLRV